MKHTNNVISCRKCLYTSNHAFGITFNESGLCSGCLIHEEKNTIDWEGKKNDLIKIVNKYKSKKNHHDCIVHVDSSAESFYTIYLVKHVLGLEPLLVSYNSHFYNNIGIENLANLKTVFNCDFFQYSLNLIKYKSLVKESFFKYKHILWPYIAGKTSLPVRIAVQKKIPLIIWGGLQTIEQVGMFSHHDEIQMSRWHRKEHELFGIDENDFVKSANFVKDSDLDSVRYPDDFDIHQNGIIGIYLSNYFRWDPWSQNNYMLKYRFKPEDHKRSFDPFEYSGCSVFMGVHDLSKEIRRGYTKVVDQLSREIRFNRIDKRTAKIFLNNFKELPVNNINMFFDFLGIEQTSVDWIKKYFFNNKSQQVNKKNLKSYNTFNIKSKYKPKKFFISYGKGIYL